MDPRGVGLSTQFARWARNPSVNRPYSWTGRNRQVSEWLPCTDLCGNWQGTQQMAYVTSSFSCLALQSFPHSLLLFMLASPRCLSVHEYSRFTEGLRAHRANWVERPTPPGSANGGLKNVPIEAYKLLRTKPFTYVLPGVGEGFSVKRVSGSSARAAVESIVRALKKTRIPKTSLQASCFPSRQVPQLHVPHHLGFL